MTLGFLVHRKGTLKVNGSVIQAALDRGHDVVLFWDPDERKPGEAVTRADVAPWPAARIVRHNRHAPLAPLLSAEGVRALLAPSLYNALVHTGHEPELAALREAGVRLYSLDYILDHVSSAPEAYRVIDTTFYSSEFMRDLHWRLMADRFARLTDVDRASRSAVCGLPMLDQLALVDRAAVRKRYRLDPDQPVVLLMSLKMAVPEPWRRLVWGRRIRVLRAARAIAARRFDLLPQILATHGYRDLVAAARDLARRAGGVLIVKSRDKNDDPRFLRTLADAYVFDESVYPYTSIELLAISDLCVHFQSGAVVEAAFAGVPSVSVAVPQDHLKGRVIFEEAFDARPGGLQSFKDVVWSVDHREAAARLGSASLGDYRMDPDARARYVATWAGPDDTRSSARVLETIERAARGESR